MLPEALAVGSVVGPAGLLTALLLGLSVAVAVWRPARRSGAAGVRWGSDQGRPSARSRRSRVGPRSASALAGAAVLLVVGGVPGMVLGVLIAVGLPGPLSRLEPAAVAAERRQLAGDLPLVLELLAGCLAGGAAPGAAATAVGRAVGGPCGARLLSVAGALAVGSTGEDAWSRLAGPVGPASEDPLAAAARALSRAAEGGAPVAAAMARSAAEARAAARLRGQAAARRAGVLAVAPLGLCFLPAFVLLGVVPVIAGLAGPVLAQF